MNYLSSSSDEKVLDAVAEIESPRLFLPRSNPFDKYTDGEFRTRYRLQRNTTVVVIGILEEELSPITLRNHSLSAGDQILVTLRFYATGDSAYALKDCMMTLLLNPTTPAEQNYNNAHIQTRNCIERCFGVWKRRFACLSLGLRTKVDNIAINENDTNYFEDVVVDEEVEQEVMQVNNGGGNAVRRALIENVFANL
ncbi:hypothetical protein ILUMI_13277 [Ignelater luminosus]|uniref:DDE Tnp4 domain-containing protein n=1 Tax=Ignelater luminosus TaxID=2038154 RepID=A0A8K0CYW0_IGNLU|nr:hypothetical protein ILUMI_13277 [Ignelater luminosus]